MLSITAYGEKRRAYACKHCGGLDTDRHNLNQHERRHDAINAQLKAAAGFKPAKKRGCPRSKWDKGRVLNARSS